MKENAYYFSHDYGARNDRKLIRLRNKLKMEGIGVFWSLVEMLYEEGGKIHFQEIPHIAEELRVKQGIIDQVITAFDLFTNDGNFFWSESVKRRLDKRLEKSEKAKASAAQRWRNANAIRTHTEGNANKGKKRKEKKRKEGDMTLPPTVEEVIEYFLEKGYNETGARKAHEYYALNNWHDSEGKPVKAWKQKMFSVWFKDEYMAGSNVHHIGKLIKAVEIDADDRIHYEDGSIIPPGSYNDVAAYRKGELKISHFDRKTA